MAILTGIMGGAIIGGAISYVGKRSGG